MLRPVLHHGHSTESYSTMSHKGCKPHQRMNATAQARLDRVLRVWALVRAPDQLEESQEARRFDQRAVDGLRQLRAGELLHIIKSGVEAQQRGVQSFLGLEDTRDGATPRQLGVHPGKLFVNARRHAGGMASGL
jgi:hypothetical protein